MSKNSITALLKNKIKHAESIKVYLDHVRAAFYAIDVDRFCVVLYKHDGTKIGHVMDDSHIEPKLSLESHVVNDLVEEWRKLPVDAEIIPNTNTEVVNASTEVVVEEVK